MEKFPGHEFDWGLVEGDASPADGARPLVDPAYREIMESLGVSADQLGPGIDYQYVNTMDFADETGMYQNPDLVGVTLHNDGRTVLASYDDETVRARLPEVKPMYLESPFKMQAARNLLKVMDELKYDEEHFGKAVGWKEDFQRILRVLEKVHEYENDPKKQVCHADPELCARKRASLMREPFAIFPTSLDPREDTGEHVPKAYLIYVSKNAASTLYFVPGYVYRPYLQNENSKNSKKQMSEVGTLGRTLKALLSAMTPTQYERFRRTCAASNGTRAAKRAYLAMMCNYNRPAGEPPRKMGEVHEIGFRRRQDSGTHKALPAPNMGRWTFMDTPDHTNYPCIDQQRPSITSAYHDPSAPMKRFTSTTHTTGWSADQSFESACDATNSRANRPCIFINGTLNLQTSACTRCGHDPTPYELLGSTFSSIPGIKHPRNISTTFSTTPSSPNHPLSTNPSDDTPTPPQKRMKFSFSLYTTNL